MIIKFKIISKYVDILSYFQIINYQSPITNISKPNIIKSLSNSVYLGKILQNDRVENRKGIRRYYL